MARLSQRLEEVIRLTPPGAAAADIGTDHARVPIELVRRGKFPRAIACDIRRGPLRSAAEHVAQAGLTEQVELRLGDGLAPLAAGEADVILISGMGGALMERILREGKDRLKSVRALILSPQSEPAAVRSFLQQSGFSIDAESCLWEDGKYYVILRACPGRQRVWTGADLAYGKRLLAEGSPALRLWLEKEEKRLEGVIRRLEKLPDGGRGALDEKWQELALLRKAREKMAAGKKKTGSAAPRPLSNGPESATVKTKKRLEHEPNSNRRPDREESIPMSRDIMKEADEFIAANRENIIRDIARLVAVPSTQGEPSEDAPFGAGPARALREALSIAQELGLETRNCENRIGYACAGGHGDRYLATVTHLDVVPAGNGWLADPFVMREREGFLLGRGVQDDKGPAVITLYALKFLQDAGVTLKHPVRALLGTNEETGMGDVRYYLEHYPAPLFCFSPDADFPLIHGEKGIYHALLVSQKPVTSIVSLQGGVAPNVVPDRAEAVIRTNRNPAGTENITAEYRDGLLYLTAYGKGGHASMPAGTVNAIGLLVDYMLEQQLVTPEEEEFLCFDAQLHRTTDGSSLGIDARDSYFTPLTAVGGMIFLKDGCICQTLDCRYPTTTSGAAITARLSERAGSAARVALARDSAPFYKDPSSPELQACIQAYNSVTGENARSFTIGGGTYAKGFPNGVAFGPEHPGRVYPEFVGMIHGAEEGASVEELLEALKIYICALLKLEELDLWDEKEETR